MKRKRHQKILQIIKNQAVETQEELAKILQLEGFLVTQATVSRDIRELSLTKISTGGGRQKYVQAENPQGLSDKYVKVCREGYLSMDMAQNILVMKTVPGMASAVAAAMDAMKFEEVAGCIAGDDTVMMAVKSVEETKALMEKLAVMFESH